MESENTTLGNKRVALLVERSTKHSQAGRETKSRTYMIWSGMVGRCHRSSDTNYKWYGAKGVTVCDRWRKFENFFEDMGEAPEGSHIHRANCSLFYSKETCQWISEHEHIGLHNSERGWGARLTRTELIDRCFALKQELAANRELLKEQTEQGIRLSDQVDEIGAQLAAEREKVKALEKRKGAIKFDAYPDEWPDDTPSNFFGIRWWKSY